MRKGICVMLCGHSHIHGYVKLSQETANSPVLVNVDLFGAKPGKHGFHVHNSGNLVHGATSLCSHFNPTGMHHGALNSKSAHAGDLGNLVFDEDGICQTEFEAKFISLSGKLSVIGRSLVMHEKEDDLGMGGAPDSLTTGDSGGRLFFGVIGLDECHD